VRRQQLRRLIVRTYDHRVRAPGVAGEHSNVRAAVNGESWIPGRQDLDAWLGMGRRLDALQVQRPAVPTCAMLRLHLAVPRLGRSQSRPEAAEKHSRAVRAGELSRCVTRARPSCSTTRALADPSFEQQSARFAAHAVGCRAMIRSRPGTCRIAERLCDVSLRPTGGPRKLPSSGQPRPSGRSLRFDGARR
jgi:hypothetical protein